MEKFTIDRQPFCRQYDKRTNTEQISSIHPYDETEYHWARRGSMIAGGAHQWVIYRNGKRICAIWCVLSDCNENETVARKLLELDNQAGLKRTGGIW